MSSENTKPQEEPVSPYQDPELIEIANGDRAYLDRLVGLRLAQDRLAEDPENKALQNDVENMQFVLQEYIQGKQ